MQTIWNGTIQTSQNHSLSGISICGPIAFDDVALSWPDDISIEFLSVLATANVPLHIAAGPPCRVFTDDDETRRWFEQILFAGQVVDQLNGIERAWWSSSRPNSPLGILLGVRGNATKAGGSRPKVTELLLVACRDTATDSERRLTPPRSSPVPDHGLNGSRDAVSYQVHAIPLSSDLLQEKTSETVTPPASPDKNDEKIEGEFIPSIFDSIENTEIINVPPVRKRKSVTDALDAATDRLRKARRKGGEGVAAAAASGARPEDSISLLKHRRSVSNSQVSLHTRPLSRASSVTSSHLHGTHEHSVPALTKRSSLSMVKSIPNDPDSSTDDAETRNKETISRLVMVGMRLHGLSQSKSRKSRSNSMLASPVLDAVNEDLDSQRKKDEEFKLVYHQVYKGACFAFRHQIAVVNLGLHTAAVQDIVDKLLALYCTDPLVYNSTGDEEKFTPGGRKAFGMNDAKT